MNCEICKIRPAKVHYTEIVNNQMTKMNLCLECAEEKGIDVQKGGNFGLGDLVAGLIDTAVDADAERISKVQKEVHNSNPLRLVKFAGGA